MLAGSLAGGCAAHDPPGGRLGREPLAPGHDIVPAAWVGHHGACTDPPDGSRRGEARVFPSLCTAAEPLPAAAPADPPPKLGVNFTCTNFVKPANRIADGAAYRLRFRDGTGAEGTIG